MTAGRPRESAHTPPHLADGTEKGTAMTTTTQSRTIELTDRELTILVNALKIAKSDFGHDEADVVREMQALLTKLATITTS